MRQIGLRLTRFISTSKLFFAASQRAFNDRGNFKRSRQIIVKSRKSTNTISQRLGCRSLAIVALIVIFLSPARAQTNLPEPNREQLLNGLTILFSPRPGDANVLLKLRIHSGAAFDLAGKAGTMALLGDALFPDPTTREYVTEQLGGRLEVSTTYDAIDVTIDGKASELERMIELIRNAVVTTNLSVENVTRLRDARIKQLSETASLAPQLADREIAKRLFGSFPYGTPASGTVESLARVERADLMLAHERFLHSDNATLIVIGGVDRSRLMRDLRQLLGLWPKGDRTYPATFRQPNAPDARVLLFNQLNAKNAEIRIAVRGLARSDRDATVASLLAQIARDRWQAAVPDLSSPFVRHEAYALPGMFVFGASVPMSSAAKAISAAQDVMRMLAQEGPTTTDLSRVLASSLWMSHRPSPAETLADSWLDAETYKVSTSNLSLDPSRVTAADIQRVAARLFKGASPATIVVGDANQLKSAFGSKAELRDAKPDIKTPTDPATPAKKP